MSNNKRKLIDTVDLTGEDDDDFPVHGPQKSAKPSGGTVTGPGGRQYPTAPSSSHPASSRTGYGGYATGNHHLPSRHGYSRYPGSQYRHDVASTTFHSQQERNSWLASSTQAQEEEIRREIDPEADFDDDVYDNYQLYGILNTKIVGCRFYNGRATVGEYVKARREPNNPYDKNAIRIDNCMGVQIGHIGRQVAAKLSPLMDSRELLLEGALTGPKTHYDCPIGLKMFGTSDPAHTTALKEKMQALRLPVIEFNRAEKERKRREKERAAREKAAQSLTKKGGVVVDTNEPKSYAHLSSSQGAGASSVDMEMVLNGTATFNPRDVQDAVDRFVAGEATLEKMPMAKQSAALATVLMTYQRQGLQWMLDKESPKLPWDDRSEPVQLWKMSHGLYTNIATNFSISKAPELASGGILADDMGLGKTLQVISIIIADPQRGQQPTLIVSPLSVMSNWRQQAELHVKANYRPKVLIYHGQDNKGLAPAEFQQYDMVITTYQTLTLELFPYGKKTAVKTPSTKGLFSIAWRRVVLDEGHSIRNPKSKMAVAACTLEAQSLWVLTGTPLVNSLKDLYSLVKFLRMSGGLGEFEIFNSTLIRPLKRNDPNARILLQALMSSFVLRRMKDMSYIDLKLPEITFHKIPVKLLPHEQERYDAFKSEAKGLLEAAKAKKGDGNTMTNLLEVLLRLRQTCNHWKLCGDARIKRVLELVEENKAIDVTNSANRKALQDLLQIKIDSQEECPICMDTIKEPVITACAHAFCRECIERTIELQHKCPICRGQLASTELLVNPAANFGEGDDGMEIDADESSSKIEALMRVLTASQQDQSTKFVVFSQWTSFLDLVQTQMSKHGISYARLDGKMNSTKRDAAMERLSSDASCKVLLASLSVCSVGLNLVAANTVILSDSWWAPAIEDQAVDRVHRLGQLRPCKVLRLVVEQSVEDEVLGIQAKKRKLTSMAFGEKEGRRSRQEMRAGTLNDIARLLA